MNYYEKIREMRNERLYNGEPPLEFGCEILLESECTKTYLSDFDFMYVFSSNGETCNSSYDNGIGDDKIVKNLGKEVSLQDVMRLLNERGGVQKCLIDLTKEIKEQDEEILKEIYQLIK